MAAIVVVVILGEMRGGFRDCTAGPPAADGASDAADDGADRSASRADGRSREHATNATDTFTCLVDVARVAVVLAECGILCALDAAVSRVAIAIVHGVPPVSVS